MQPALVGVEILDAPFGLESNGLWCRDPAGLLVEEGVIRKGLHARLTRDDVIVSATTIASGPVASSSRWTKTSPGSAARTAAVSSQCRRPPVSTWNQVRSGCARCRNSTGWL